ncbi:MULTISPECIES: ribose-5-phosphate isomerase RpiA [Neobacillus]|uniref:Ribose-5-phosphate isomerase A n=1 Tax=Neobacillus rhizophilus TaxID=2833579 RepID=A0A942UAH8_9BACI|nr:MULTISPECIES: ribose-5-phosphate isomerase RpiA [Neobacillus]MBS4214549.1 ribose-5-phosphate isomerase RpiA [Neobacillus rhizophilus]
MNEKNIVGELAADFVKDGMVVGLGTGSTVYFTLMKLGALVEAGLSIQGIPTSVQTAELAKKLQIPLASMDEVKKIDIAIDGADEFDSNLNLIKGGGGALVREKIVAKAAEKFIVVADPSKMVKTLGAFPLPVEVVPFGAVQTENYIRELQGKTKLRQTNGMPFQTDNGNFIIDCSFPSIIKPQELESILNNIPGVVDNGLFVGMADMVITIDPGHKPVLLEREKQ